MHFQMVSSFMEVPYVDYVFDGRVYSLDTDLGMLIFTQARYKIHLGWISACARRDQLSC